MKKRKGRRRSGHDDHHGGEDESAKKKAKPAGPDICDDVVLSIFSRLTTREAARCAALSKHHRQLIGGVDFWRLHRRLSPPLPRPSVAYMLTVGASGPTSENKKKSPPAPVLDHALSGCVFHDFHLAGLAGGGGSNGLRYSRVDRVHLYHKYVGTCSGVVLLAPKSFDGGVSIVLFNPAMAGSEEAVPLELPALPGPGLRYRVAGFGYGTSSRAHKVLVTREQLDSPDERTSPPLARATYRARELLVYTLGGSPSPEPDDQRLRSVLPELDASIGGKPVYLDGKVYLLADNSRVLAFDVDDETVATIDLPGGRVPGKRRRARSGLMEVSGRLCVATGAGTLTLWLLAADQQWVQLCKLWCGDTISTKLKLAGAWDCGGMVLLYTINRASKTPYLHMYDTRTDKTHRLTLPSAVARQGASRHVLCWGYRPTLVSPGSIVGAPPRQRGVVVAPALNPLLERDVDAGRERTLEAACLMNLLRYIMTKLPDNAHDVFMEINRRSLPFSLR